MKSEIHEGQELRELILSLTTIEKLSKKINKHRNTISGWFNLVKVDAENLLLVGKGLRYDITANFPRLKKYELSEELHFFNEDPASYLKQIQSVQEKLLNEQQASADSQLQISMLQDKIRDMQSIISDKNDLLRSKEEIIEMLRDEIKGLKSGVKSA